LFTVKIFYEVNRGDVVKTIEIDPRMVRQFVDLIEKINGINTFEIMLPLTTGQISPFTVSVSIYLFTSRLSLRIFQIRKSYIFPKHEQLITVNHIFPGIHLNFFYSERQKMLDTDIDCVS
jgi:hypothetical protein